MERSLDQIGKRKVLAPKAASAACGHEEVTLRMYAFSSSYKRVGIACFRRCRCTRLTLLTNGMLTKAEGKACYQHILNKIEEIEQTPEYQEAMQKCGRSMVQWLVHVYPLIMRAKLEAVQDYGITPTPEGIRQFEDEMAALCENDDELKELEIKHRNKLTPNMSSTSAVENNSAQP
uniref:Uncharacterized protein n=1 Tax=Trichuris muris TaxID=70415 RepID=A0A5S6QZA5_TRIMR